MRQLPISNVLCGYSFVSPFCMPDDTPQSKACQESDWPRHSSLCSRLGDGIGGIVVRWSNHLKAEILESALQAIYSTLFLGKRNISDVSWNFATKNYIVVFVLDGDLGTSTFNVVDIHLKRLSEMGFDDNRIARLQDSIQQQPYSFLAVYKIWTAIPEFAVFEIPSYAEADYSTSSYATAPIKLFCPGGHYTYMTALFQAGHGTRTGLSPNHHFDAAYAQLTRRARVYQQNRKKNIKKKRNKRRV